MDSKTRDFIIKNIPLFKELSKKFGHYQVVEIDVIRIIYFITQFETYEKVRIIIELLNNIDFINSERMTYLLKSAYEKIQPELRNKPLISSLGSIQDSSAVVCYQLLKQLFDNEKQILNAVIEVNSIGKYIKEDNPSSIIFFDDNITSGTQLYDFFEELIEGKENAELVKTPLNSEEFEKLKRIPIRVCYAIQLAEKSNEVIQRIRRKYDIDLEIYTGKVDFDNYLNYQSRTMQSEEEAKFAKEFIREISNQLYSDKNWSTETKYSRLLGYGNLGKLTVFYYNVPKSFIPILWKFGEYNGAPWFPLFPETQEQKKILKSGTEFEYYRIQTINTWINSQQQNRKPDLLFGIYNNGDILPNITIEIPSKELVIEYIESLTSILNEQYKPNQIMVYGQSTSFNPMIRVPTSKKLSQFDYNSYMEAVDNYNADLMTYYENVKQHILKFYSKTKVCIEVFNKGNIAASNCIIKLFYNTGELVFNFFENLPKPKFNIEKPQVNNFNSSESRVIISSSSPLLSVISLNSNIKTEPLEENANYEYKIFNGRRIGHNDRQRENIEITKMDLNMNLFEIPYEINFDEEAETIKGSLTIKFVESDIIQSEIKEIIKQYFKDYIIK